MIKGRVQGVGFRATARLYAKKLGLRGTVKNLPTYEVEIIAEGSQENLERLITLLKEEFFIAEVIETAFSSGEMIPADFIIIA